MHGITLWIGVGTERRYFVRGKLYGVYWTVENASSLWKVRIAAYCLMSNHYHLLVQTPEANLSRYMRHINGLYTQYFNRTYKSDGQLFRGRYKSIVIDGDSYLLELVRYIHHNPLNAGLAKRLEDYSWSSHRAYISKGNEGKWMHNDFVLSILEENKSKTTGKPILILVRTGSTRKH